VNRRRIDRTEQVQKTGAFVRSATTAVLRVVGALALTAALGYGAFAAWGYLRTSEKFALRSLAFTGVGHASEEELTRSAGLVAGTNIFAIDLAAAARAMEAEPWVHRVRIARELPDTLRIAVDEHHAVALVAVGGLYAVDADGILFKRVTSGDKLDLPVITGLSRDEVEQGKDRGALATALGIVEAYGVHGMGERAPLSELHVGGDGGELAWTAFCGDEPVEVHLGPIGKADGPDAVVAVLGRLVRVWDELEHRGARARSIDLGNRQRPEWVAARLE
jgi:cell division protein FtsQ